MNRSFPNEHQFKQAIDVLHAGGIVAFPTETYYGLGVDIDNPEAVKALFHLKKRDPDKPILVLIDERSLLSKIVAAIPKSYEELIHRFWPGPLTLLFPVASDQLVFITGSTNTIGVRLSPHPVAMELCHQWGKPLTATSANISGCQPAETADMVREIFGDEIDYILDGGKTSGGKCSTVVGLDKGKLTLVRPGRINFLNITR